MSELNNLIPISYDNPERPTVSGRELHEFLQVKTAYKDWFPRMVEYGFTEGEDFNSLKIERVQDEGGRKVSRTLDDHQLTIPMAKELCMIQRNERGKKARQYFLAVEAQWNSPEAVMRRAVLIAQRQNDQLKAANRQLLAENNDLKPDAEYARAVCVGKNCRTTTSLAKDYGLSAEKLNSILHGLKIQYKTSDGQWVLYAKYSGKGYTKNRKSTPFQHKSTGDWSTGAASGYKSTGAASGDCSTGAASGNYCRAEAFGKNSIAVVNGACGKACGALGCYLVLTEYDDDGHMICAKMARVDGSAIKENVYYTLKNGEFVEVKP